MASFYLKIKGAHDRVKMLEERLADDPDNLFLNRWYLESPQIRIGSRSENYRKKLDEHPGDPKYLYLYGRALMGSGTPKAIDYLNRAIAKDPDLPWTYWSLMEVYASPNFKNPAKLGEEMLTFTRLCPTDQDGFQYLGSVEDTGTVGELAVRFRTAVEGAKTSRASYPGLWAAEFRATNPQNFDKLRERVAEDLKRVKELDPNNAAALIAGYKLIGDAEAAKAMEEKSAARSTPDENDVVEAWLNAHRIKPTASEEERDQYYRDRLQASRQWVKDFPDDDNAWSWRFHSLSQLKSTPDREVEKAGDHLMEMVAQGPGYWSWHPYAIDVGREWLKREIRLTDCIRLGEQAIAELDRGPGSENDMLRGSQAALLKMLSHNLTTARFEALAIQAGASRKLELFEKTRSVINEMKQSLDRDQADNPYLEFMYLVQLAGLAEAEGHKLDALSYYLRAINRWDHDPEVKKWVRALWKELGGSQEAFNLWTTRPELPKTAPAKPAIPTEAGDQSARPAVITDARPWTQMNKPLNTLNAADLTGKFWTATDLKGKTTFIAVWATWCGPCLAELPYLQRLYDQLKGRKGLQAISINVDENPGLVGPFMRENRYTFPVLLGKALVDALTPESGIPRNWITDANANLRLESIGFDGRSQDWPQYMIEKLSEPLP